MTVLQSQKDRAADLRLQREYGITLEEYNKVAAYQKGVCAICGNKPSNGKRLHVDHCHATGLLRGCLCLRCNRAIAKFDDNAVLMQNGANYILRPPLQRALGRIARTAPGRVGTKKRAKLLKIAKAIRMKRL